MAPSCLEVGIRPGTEFRHPLETLSPEVPGKPPQSVHSRDRAMHLVKFDVLILGSGP